MNDGTIAYGTNLMDIAIMIEGQNGLNWTRWQDLARIVEASGYAGLYRSDHYTNPTPPDIDSLELWVSLTWLASHTERIGFGPLVSPISFRQPTMTARMAAAVDDLSGGRLILGLGAGWQEREHRNYGWDLLDLAERFDRFEEGLKIIRGLLKQDTPFGLDGQYYQIQDAVVLPRPQRPGGPPILIGGNGPKRTLPFVARYADAWNCVYQPASKFKELSARLDELLEEQGRQPADIHRSLMTGVIFGQTETELEDKLSQRDQSATELRDRGLLVGTGRELQAQLARLSEAGV